MSKNCAHCGKQLERKRLQRGELEPPSMFARRKYCDRACMAAGFDAKPSKSEKWSTTHYHARKLVSQGPCKRCGTPDARDVHHKDGDHQNNSPENLERICRSCHIKEHQRKASCTICGKPQKGLGFCDKHYQRFKRWGDPLSVKTNQHTALGQSVD